MDYEAEIHERMGDHTPDRRVKHQEFDRPMASKSRVTGWWPLSFAILLFLVCCGTAHAQVLRTSASWGCVCSECQTCEEGPCCNDACTIAGNTTCVSTECTGHITCLPQNGVPPANGTGSKCFTSSRFEIGYKQACVCAVPHCSPDLCFPVTCATSFACPDSIACFTSETIDIQHNLLSWGTPASGADKSSSVAAHGLNQGFLTKTKMTVELARLDTFNGTILGTTEIGHATLNIKSEPVPGDGCFLEFGLGSCNNEVTPLSSVSLKAFFYNTPNLVPDTNPDADFLNADFLCFPELNAGLLCDSPDPELVALCPAACASDSDLCPRCLRIPEDTLEVSGASIRGVILPGPVITSPQSPAPDTKYSSMKGTNSTLIVPVLVADPFGEVTLAPFWQVAIDALPDACPNFLQLRNDSAGTSATGPVVEVAAFGTDDVDVHDIDTDRVRGIVPATGEAVAPISIEFLDVGAPTGSGLECACGSSLPDGKPDMVLRFPAAAWLQAWKGTSQLGNQISVSFRRLSDDAAAETADCVTLGVCPEADTVAPTVALTAPTGTQELPIVVNFTAADADGLDGDVVAQRILLDGCPVLDGDRDGDRDGILSAGEATIDTKALCGVARTCHRNNFKRPVLTVEAVDCNGNIGRSTVQLKSKLHVDGSICKEFGNWHDGQGEPN